NNHFAGKMLHQITSAEMSEFETKRRADGVSTSTIRRDLACLSSLMTSAMDWEWMDANPVLPFLKQRGKRGLKEGAARTRYLTEKEERWLIAAATSRESKTKSGKPLGKRTAAREAIVLAIDTRLRREELFGLTWKQVDLLRGLIDTGTKTKSGRPRKVPVPARSAQILARLPRHVSGFVLGNPETGSRYVQMNKGLSQAGESRGSGMARSTSDAGCRGCSATARAWRRFRCCSAIHPCWSLSSGMRSSRPKPLRRALAAQKSAHKT